VRLSGTKRARRNPRPSRPVVDIRLAAAIDETRAAPNASWVLCPAAAHFPGRCSVWLSVLATHNSNEQLLTCLAARTEAYSKVYAGVFAVDSLRDRGQLIRQLKALGVFGVVNFPSTSFIDGEAGATLTQLSLGVDREIEFLAACAKAGLRTAGVARSLDAAARLIDIGIDFLLLHAGPPSRNGRRHERELIAKVRGLTKASLPILLPLSAVVPRPTQEERQARSGDGPRNSRHKAHSVPERFLLGAAIGTGMAARAAERGGVDLLLALNAGRLRSMGAPSAACMLALRDANRLVMEFGTTEILPAASVPVLFGASALGDEDLLALVDAVAQAGFQGLVNFPSCLFLDGGYRQHMEDVGLGFEREVEMLKAGRRRGLLTLGYIRTLEEARLMARAGVDLVNIEFGWNMGGTVGVVSTLDLNEVAIEARRIIKAVRKINRHTRCLIEGGPIVTPEQMDEVCEKAGADGYIGGSTIDRVPLESAIELTTNAFKTIGRLRKQVDLLEQQLRRKVAAEALIGLGEGVRRARARVAEAIQGQLPVLIVGEPGTGRDDVARAIHEACVDPSRRMIMIECRSDAQQEIANRLFGTAKSPGLLQAAHGSTLVLKDVACLGQELQQRLLQTWRKVDRSKTDAISARIIGITSFDPSQHTERYNPELVRWLSAVRIDLPPLRERLEDLPLLIERMLRSIDDRAALDPSCYRSLLKHQWPGNITELRGVLRKSARGVGHRPILDRDVELLLKPSNPADRESFLSERDWVLEGLRRNRFRREETARYLRISRKTLYNKMLRHRLLKAPSESQQYPQGRLVHK